MASIYDIKPAFQNFLRPIVVGLANIGVTPNQITYAALFLSFIAGGAIALTHGASWALLAIPAVMFVRMALNAIDGMLAKEHDMKSDAGAMLNEMSDVLSDAALYLPFALIDGVSALWIVLFVIMAILTEMAGVLGALIGGVRRYDGPMGKSDRAFVIGALSLVLGLGVSPAGWFDGVMIVATMMGAWTVLRRSVRGLKS
ncbi:CDP-alcohol phosphatidyltransferase family protein [uncultured Sulfuricurvum sp.]|uniref:CDP-alcohol phosphatidyltransferase family protein n=1 Tax=uncultured Sulfuricurvum sp. TaxID=430693 RepID=UPI00260BFF01|nr:CDP-alcohol phosphatidyltransferase family protein [uncultured Sulfuricurvum sp.]